MAPLDTQDITDNSESPDCPSLSLQYSWIADTQLLRIKAVHKQYLLLVATGEWEEDTGRIEIAAADSRIGSYGSYGTDCCEAMIPRGRKTTKASLLMGKVDRIG